MKEKTKFELCEGLHYDVAALYEALEDTGKIASRLQVKNIRETLDFIEGKFLSIKKRK